MEANGDIFEVERKEHLIESQISDMSRLVIGLTRSLTPGKDTRVLILVLYQLLVFSIEYVFPSIKFPPKHLDFEKKKGSPTFSTSAFCGLA